mgnify:CR=1 FL=1
MDCGQTYSLNSGVSLYFANSSNQSSCESGGMTPVIGFHSVMLRPDSVRRVTPPTTTMAKTRVADAMSHPPTTGGARVGSGASAAACPFSAALEDSAVGVVVVVDDLAEEWNREVEPSICRTLDDGWS